MAPPEEAAVLNQNNVNGVDMVRDSYSVHITNIKQYQVEDTKSQAKFLPAGW